MEGICDSNFESLSAGIYELPGEPAVVINGVPDLSVEDGNINQGTDPAEGTPRTVKLDKSASGVSKPRYTGFGEWLEGRKVQKLFDQKYYLGKVTEFDKETGWYRVVYEDGDFEDLEWHELQEVLQPLDITMPLKSLALKIIHKNRKSEPGVETNAVPERKSGGKTRGRRGKPSSRNFVGRG
ncbi:dirigent protein 17-like [Chenopodium quinoa]|uniref:Tudor domain-containing protein n=1 Tax=Chenopodium quinoa TaxID=63459 RepID=A0A803MXA8_CHEQI|nr:dirigent protein 17-like [Chenopodium quinoa]